MKPVNPIVEALVSRLDTNLREAFEERAGIVQFEAGKPRELAECLALLDVIRAHPTAAMGVKAVEVRRGEVWVPALALDPRVLGAEVRPVRLEESVKRLGGAAFLTAVE